MHMIIKYFSNLSKFDKEVIFQNANICFSMDYKPDMNSSKVRSILVNMLNIILPKRHNLILQ